MRPWGKGVVWVNGHCLGRFWDIGPTQTAYLPGCWLHAGKNEIVILDLSARKNRKSPASKSRFSSNCIGKRISPDPPPGEAAIWIPTTWSGRARLRRAATCRKSSSPRPPRTIFLPRNPECRRTANPYAAIAELDLLDADGKPSATTAGRLATWTARNARPKTARRRMP